MDLQSLFKVPQALPAVPEVAARLIATFEDDDIDFNRIAADVDHDPVLVAKVLQRANSAFFRLLRPVATVREALQVLGLNKLRALVVSTVLNDSFHTVAAINLDQYWNHSLASAELARYIASPLSMDESLAFTAGLLHGIGELVMHAGMPEVMLAIDREAGLLDEQRAAVQYEALGYSQAEAGAELARRWRFPRRLTEALEQQHKPLEFEQPEPLAAVVHLAVWRARLHGQRAPTEQLIHSYPDAVGSALGLDPDLLVAEDLAPLANLKDL
jgi:putative nucleotidyltransferase with HDIG domain